MGSRKRNDRCPRREGRVALVAEGRGTSADHQLGKAAFTQEHSGGATPQTSEANRRNLEAEEGAVGEKSSVNELLNQKA